MVAIPLPVSAQQEGNMTGLISGDFLRSIGVSDVSERFRSHFFGLEVEFKLESSLIRSSLGRRQWDIWYPCGSLEFRRVVNRSEQPNSSGELIVAELGEKAVVSLGDFCGVLLNKGHHNKLCIFFLRDLNGDVQLVSAYLSVWREWDYVISSWSVRAHSLKSEVRGGGYTHDTQLVYRK